MDSFVSFMVSILMWLTPSPIYAQGELIRYGPQSLVERVAEFRGYDLSYYPNRCGVSLMSPSDLGKLVWIRQADGSWFGPCLSIDTAARQDFYQIVYEWWEVAELPNWMTEQMGFCCGQWGEIYIGECPPTDLAGPEYYRPGLEEDTWPYDVTPSMWPYPVQQLPVICP